MQDEQRWAQQLKKSRHQRRQTETMDFDTQEAVLKKNITQDTLAMQEAYGHQNKREMERLMNHLIQLRAELAAIALAREQKTFGKIDELAIEDEIEAYLHDTLMLATAVRQT